MVSVSLGFLISWMNFGRELAGKSFIVYFESLLNENGEKLGFIISSYRIIYDKYLDSPTLSSLLSLK